MSTKKNDQKANAGISAEAVDAENKPAAFPRPGADPQGKDTPLDETERQLLNLHENSLKHFLGNFLTVGTSLRAIRDQRLYREKSKRFEDYCEAEWHISPQYAYRQINAVTCYALLEKECRQNGETILPRNESHIRPLVEKLEPEQWVPAWKQVVTAVAGKRITGDVVEVVVLEMVDQPSGQPAKSRKPAKNKRSSTSSEAKQTLDQIAKLVTKALKKPSALKAEQLKKFWSRSRA